MRQFVLNLVSSSSRPLVCLDNNLIALLDTGAELPVWTDTEESLKSVFKAELVRENTWTKTNKMVTLHREIEDNSN